jgi:outer membrane protein assembly factor BamC
VGVPLRLSALSLAVLLGGCSSIENMFSNDKVDYRSPTNSAKGKPLDVPPDLSQLARDSRYQPQGGVVSAAATPGSPNAPAMQPVSAAVAPLAQGDVRIERDGSQRWLVVPMPPEQLWPLLRTFWQERGLPIVSDNPQTGVMETDWVENRAKLPQDAIRNTIGRLLDAAYDTGLRDRYRTRVERTATGGSEVYISHRGMEEIYTGERKDSTTWQPRAPDPGLEAEMLSQLMVRLGSKEEVARTAVAGAPELPARARALGGSGTALEVDEPFDRAWRRVGLALDRSGFTVEDRDRAGGLYFVRYIDPKNDGKDEPSWWSKLFSGAKGPTGPEKYRVAVKGSGEKTTVSVLTSSGDANSGETGQRIVGILVKELR